MDDEPAVSDSQLQAEVNARREEVSRYLPRDRIRALILSLQNPPISTKSAAIKVIKQNLIHPINLLSSLHS